jgi:hypothetical protein
MKKILYIIGFLVITNSLFSQYIAEEYLFPFPRLVDSTYYVVTNIFSNNVSVTDSITIEKSTGFLEYILSINAYYTHSLQPSTGMTCDTINLSPYIESTGMYKIYYFLNYYMQSSDSMYVPDTAIHHINVISSVNNLTNNKKLFKLFPNPTSGKITVEAEGIEKIEIMNIQGKQIYTGIKNEIDLSNNSKGIYIIKVTTEKGVVADKVVLE